MHEPGDVWRIGITSGIAGDRAAFPAAWAVEELEESSLSMAPTGKLLVFPNSTRSLTAGP